jgi:hypothetical protein
MTEPEVIKVLGKPSRIYDAGFIIWNLDWKQFPVNVVFFDRAGRNRRNGSVTRIITQSAIFRARDGLGVGSKITDLIAVFGEPVDRQADFLFWGGFAAGYIGSSVTEIVIEAPFP